MGQSPCCEKEELKRGPWMAEEDRKLIAYIQKHGHGSWRTLPEKAGLQRCGKSCRLRWINYLRPDIKRGKFTLQEEQTIIQLHALLGNRWSSIATHLPRRTDNEIKNHWNTHIKKRLIKMGIDPMTHKPKMDALSSPAGHGKNTADLSHIAQWESARLEAEARLVAREAKQLPNPTKKPAQLLINKAVAPTDARPKCLDVLKAWQGVVTGMFAFASHGVLESPTSTLNFSNGGRNVQFLTDSAISVNDTKWFDKPNQMQEFEEITDDSINIMYSTENAWFEESFKSGSNVENIMEGLSEAIACNDGIINSLMDVEVPINGNGGENIVEKRNYWDSLHSLFNSSPAAGSPEF
ncbi:hypothetical protein SLEP1_g12378 [Rubroshorea leprosula]|uniref:Uncharacterized protein n=1 Tax=Rubroshorea leprosula TaxID=152421 RepID=A0AAV5IN09_9ROSI|nr:hypothetical protein SLEP1_g12378 [Rubroshorea leprosula]